MNTHSNAMPKSHIELPVAAPAVISGSRRMYWSLRRELWEYRSIYIAPLAAAAVFLFGFLISAIHLPAKMRGLSALDPAQQREAILVPYDMAAGLIMLTALIVGVFYTLDALHGERRDRSILFWKSLPVSDLTTVLSKASIPLLVLPVLAFTITITLQFIMLLLSSAVVMGSGLNVGAFWTQLSFVQMSLLLLYHLLTVHSLWYAPFYGWLLLVSAWARRAAFLWAALPLIPRPAAARRGGSAPAGWRRRSGRSARYHAHGPNDTRHSGSFREQPWPVARPGNLRSLPRRGGPAAPLSRTDLTIATSWAACETGARSSDKERALFHPRWARLRAVRRFRERSANHF